MNIIKKYSLILFAFSSSSMVLGQGKGPSLHVVATSKLRNWNGVAVSNDKRIFADFPRSDKRSNPSVIEIADGKEVPFPGAGWNSWQPGKDPKTGFVNVNALYINRADNHLWVVDAGDPFDAGQITSAPKLVEIDLIRNKVVSDYLIGEEFAPKGSHLNDMRILGDEVYITESGTGAILVLNRKTKKLRRLLAYSSFTKADLNVHPVVDGIPLQGAGGNTTVINVDQLELSPDGKILYFMSPFGPNLYRIATEDLLNENLSDKELEKRVSIDQKVKPVGGILMDHQGNLYLSEVETHSIRCVGPDQQTKWILSDSRLIWPDAYSEGSDGSIYVAVSQNSNMPFMHQGQDTRIPPFYIFSFKPTK